MILNSQSFVINWIQAFEGNPHDSKIIKPLEEQMIRHETKLPHEIIYDRCGRGTKHIIGVDINTIKTIKPKFSISEIHIYKLLLHKNLICFCPNATH
ncbi:MAG: hypothetical protein LBQ28_09985 [Prevotellaceae bacterium]|nr:hypothetical protein [Prevotellaceae bacterium]